jgi:hypothetical protein
METVKTEKKVTEKVPYERPTFQQRGRLEEVTEGPPPILSGIRVM